MHQLAMHWSIPERALAVNRSELVVQLELLALELAKVELVVQHQEQERHQVGLAVVDHAKLHWQSAPWLMLNVHVLWHIWSADLCG